jgi:hypothetical protein
LYLNKCQVKCSDFGSQDAVRTLKLRACGVDSRFGQVIVLDVIEILTDRFSLGT